MSKKITITIIVAIIILIGLAVFLVISRNKAASTTDTTTSSQNFPISGTQSTVGKTSTTTSSAAAARIAKNAKSNFKLVSDLPASQATFYKRGDNLYIRYFKTLNGYIYDYDIAGNRTIPVTNTTIQNAHTAWWATSTKGIVLNSDPSTSETVFHLFNLTTVGTTSTSTSLVLTATAVNQASKNIVLSPNGTQVLSMDVEIGSNAVGKISQLDGSKTTTLFNVPLTEWNIEWPSANVVTLTTNASSAVPGYMYFVDTKSGAFKQVLGPINGLTTRTSPSAQYVAYFNASANTLTFLNTKTGTTTVSSIPALPEKCVWTKDSKKLYCATDKTIEGAIPDDWYQGTKVFQDDLYSIDPNSGIQSIIAPLPDLNNGEIDAVDLSLSPDESYLLMRNKVDNSLWTLKLK